MFVTIYGGQVSWFIEMYGVKLNADLHNDRGSRTRRETGDWSFAFSDDKSQEFYSTWTSICNCTKDL